MFDFEALYDSITPQLALDALEFAIRDKRPDWNDEMKQWILQVVEMSLGSAVGTFKGKWYKQVSGVPTGGSISVQIANITVYFVLYQVLFQKTDMMEHILELKRFIDDGTGLFTGNCEQFELWKTRLTHELHKFHLNIKPEDWLLGNNETYVHFLDVKFKFDTNGKLQTDLYVKETDAKSYLNYHSSHPNHVFSGIVYSQASRLRRIINDDNRLEQSLSVMKNVFLSCDYPKRMVENITNKVKASPRVLQKGTVNDTVDDNVIRVISTFGNDNILVKTLKSVERLTPFRFQFIKKTAPTLNQKLCHPKALSWDNNYGKPRLCARTRCKCCKTMSKSESVVGGDGKKHKVLDSGCTTDLVIYCATCKLCEHKLYVGKTINTLAERKAQHKSDFGKVIVKGSSNVAINDTNDSHALGLHLYTEHNLDLTESFDNSYSFAIFEHCTPKMIDLREHFWIQKCKTLSPQGLNLSSPFGIPLLQ